MTMKLSVKLLSGILIPVLTIPCLGIPAVTARDQDAPILTCTPADEWTALFDRAGKRESWLAADGIYSVALSGKDSLSSLNEQSKTLFFFSDTILGTANAEGKITRYNGMANHSAAILTGDSPDPSAMEFLWGSKANLALSGDLNLFRQNQWLFDCFVTGGNLYAIAFSQENWKPSKIDLIRIPISEEGNPQWGKFKRTTNIRPLLKKLPDFDYAYGMGVMCNTAEAGAPDPDGYIYIYGYRDNFAAFSQKDLIVSRIHEDDFPNFDTLRYWNGSDWVEEIEQSALLIERVSCEVSVTPITVGPYKGKYMAVYNQDVQSNRIMYAIGDTPAGPFGESVHCYTIPETGQTPVGGNGTLYTYNAKAHPHISPAGTLLISYNVNVNGVNMAQNTADYRPRFLSLDLMATDAEIRALQDAAKPDPAPQTPAVPETEDTPADPPAKNLPEEKTFPWVPVLLRTGIAAATVLGTALGVATVRRKKKST